MLWVKILSCAAAAKKNLSFNLFQRVVLAQLIHSRLSCTQSSQICSSSRIREICNDFSLFLSAHTNVLVCIPLGCTGIGFQYDGLGSDFCIFIRMYNFVSIILK